jgi:hypothetical protein
MTRYLAWANAAASTPSRYVVGRLMGIQFAWLITLIAARSLAKASS